MGSLKLAVAYDEAFCFYYIENLRALERIGFEITLFSPVHSYKLPEDSAGLYIGGGYPELHAGEISKNKQLLVDINQAASSGLPLVAECGGFMLLTKAIDTCGMCGIFDTVCEKKDRLVRFGYMEAFDKTGKWLPPDQGIRGHEFHYFDTDDNGKGAEIKKASGGSTYEEIHITDTMWAGWPHLYFGSNPGFAESFYEKCRAYAGTG